MNQAGKPISSSFRLHPSSFRPRLTTATLFELATRIFPHIPSRLGYRLCDGLAPFAPRTSAWPNMLANLEHVMPHADRVAREATARRSFVHLLKNYYDLLRSHALSPEALASAFRIEGARNAACVLQAGRGIIAVTLHTGNFSLVFEPVARLLDSDLLAVVEQLPDPELHHIVNKLRQRNRVNIVAADQQGIRTIMHTLQHGGVVVLAQDRLVTAGGVKVEFFGSSVTLPSGAATLALRTGAALIPAYVSRLPDNRGRIAIDPPILLDQIRKGLTQTEAVQQITQALARVLEGYIRADPGQWLLTNRVW